LFTPQKKEEGINTRTNKPIEKLEKEREINR